MQKANMNNEPQKMPTEEKENTYIEFILFLILGFLLGIVIKTEVSKRITIGYDDYRLQGQKEMYRMNEVQLEVKRKAEEKAKKEEETVNQQNEESGIAEGVETSR